MPQGGSDICLVVAASSFEQHDCEPAVLAVRGRTPPDVGFRAAPANLFPRLVLPHSRLLFMALLPDGASGVSVANEVGYHHALHPFRNFVARILPGSQSAHRWVLRWTRRGKHHAERFS